MKEIQIYKHACIRETFYSNLEEKLDTTRVFHIISSPMEDEKEIKLLTVLRLMLPFSENYTNIVLTILNIQPTGSKTSRFLS